MKTQVYYGEYSLKHWITLVLNSNLKLPGYQRHFCWNQDAVDEVMKQFKGKLFVPPVIIGSYSEDKKNVNLVIDGQQRLTSIILAYFKMSVPKSSKPADDENEVEGDDNSSGWDWNVILKEIQDNGHIQSEDAKNRCECKTYDYKLGGDFFETTFLGFSYIVPGNDDSPAQNVFYSKVFRSINLQGKSLSAFESRRALYFLNHELTSFFEPEFVTSVIHVKIPDSKKKLDFVRYLSGASQYVKCKNANKVAGKVRGRKLENFFEDYVYALTTDEKIESFEILDQATRLQRMQNLQDIINNLDFPQEFSSYMDSDLYNVPLSLDRGKSFLSQIYV